MARSRRQNIEDDEESAALDTALADVLQDLGSDPIPAEVLNTARRLEAELDAARRKKRSH